MAVVSVWLGKWHILPNHDSILIGVVILQVGESLFPAGQQGIVDVESLRNGDQRFESPPGQGDVEAGLLRIPIFIGVGVGDVVETIFPLVQDPQIDIEGTAHQWENTFA